MNETKNGFDGDGGDGGGFDDDSGDSDTAVTDTASLHLIRAGRSIVKHGNASARLGEAIAGIGLDLRWAGGTENKRVMTLIAAQDRIRKARGKFAAILDALDDIDRMVENEANSLHLEENGP